MSTAPSLPDSCAHDAAALRDDTCAQSLRKLALEPAATSLHRGSIDVYDRMQAPMPVWCESGAHKLGLCAPVVQRKTGLSYTARVTAYWRTDAGVTKSLLEATGTKDAQRAQMRWVAALFGPKAQNGVLDAALTQRLTLQDAQARRVSCRAVHTLCVHKMASLDSRLRVLEALVHQGPQSDWQALSQIAYHIDWASLGGQVRAEAMQGLSALCRNYPPDHLAWPSVRLWLGALGHWHGATAPERICVLHDMLGGAPRTVSAKDIVEIEAACRQVRRLEAYPVQERWQMLLQVYAGPKNQRRAQVGHVERGIGRALPKAQEHLHLRRRFLQRVQRLSTGEQARLGRLLASSIGKTRDPASGEQVVQALLSLSPEALVPVAECLDIGRCVLLPNTHLTYVVGCFAALPARARKEVAHVLRGQLSNRTTMPQLRVAFVEATAIVQTLGPWLASVPYAARRDVMRSLVADGTTPLYTLCGLLAQINPDTFDHTRRKRFLLDLVAKAQAMRHFDAAAFTAACQPVLVAHLPEGDKLDIILQMVRHDAPSVRRDALLAIAVVAHDVHQNATFKELARDTENVMRAERMTSTGRAIGYLLKHVVQTHTSDCLDAVERYLEVLDVYHTTRPTRSDVRCAQRTVYGKRRKKDLSACIRDNELASLGGARMGLADVLALVWQAIVTYAPDGMTPEDVARHRGNMKHSLVLNLADCIERDGHRVCAIGMAQRFLHVLQSYYPLHIDVVTPEARLCALTQEFAELHAARDPDAAQIEAFYGQCMRLADHWFAGRERTRFVGDLGAYLQADYAWRPADTDVRDAGILPPVVALGPWDLGSWSS